MKKENRIESNMSGHPVIATEEMTVLRAYELMNLHRFRHLPVVNQAQVVGVVSMRELEQVLPYITRAPICVVDVMARDPYCVKVGTPLSTVTREMAARKLGCAVVLNEWSHVVGIFTTTDGMRILSELLTDEQPLAVRHWGIEKFLAPEYLI